jgi:hypothetical protein
VVPLVFKTSVGREERPGCVRFAHVSAKQLALLGQELDAWMLPTGGSMRGGSFQMRYRSILIGVLLAVSLLVATGCDSITQVLNPPPVVTHVKVDAKVGKPGAALRGTLKPGAPADLPLWEGAGVTRNAVTKSRAGVAWSATLTTADPYDDVVKGMAVGFQRANWQVELQDVTSTESSTTVLTVASGSATGIVTIAARKDGTTRIGYVVTSATKD